MDDQVGWAGHRDMYRTKAGWLAIRQYRLPELGYGLAGLPRGRGTKRSPPTNVH